MKISHTYYNITFLKGKICYPFFFAGSRLCLTLIFPVWGNEHEYLWYIPFFFLFYV